MPITVIRENGRVVLPVAIRKKLRLKSGDVLNVKSDNGRIVLEPKEKNDQSWYWTARWQKKVKAALKEVEEGKVSKVHDSLEEALKALKGKT
jgi:AbrB family looped-hinge helix DNA binding protein